MIRWSILEQQVPPPFSEGGLVVKPTQLFLLLENFRGHHDTVPTFKGYHIQRLRPSGG
jgi:hypothetical protein